MELSTTSKIRWWSPFGPVDPMYMPGRFRTGSNPSKTVICCAPYVSGDFIDVLIRRWGLSNLEWAETDWTTKFLQLAPTVRPKPLNLVGTGAILIANVLGKNHNILQFMEWRRVQRSVPGPVTSSLTTHAELVHRIWLGSIWAGMNRGFGVLRRGWGFYETTTDTEPRIFSGLTSNGIGLGLFG